MKLVSSDQFNKGRLSTDLLVYNVKTSSGVVGMQSLRECVYGVTRSLEQGTIKAQQLQGHSDVRLGRRSGEEAVSDELPVQWPARTAIDLNNTIVCSSSIFVPNPD